MPDTWIQKGQPEPIKKSLVVLDWIKTHREASLGTAIIFIGLIILTGYSLMKYSEIKEIAWKNLFIAQQTAYSGNIDESINQLNSIETSFSRTNASLFSIMFKGDLYFGQNKYKEAIEQYRKILEKPKIKQLLPFALYNIGKSKESLGDFPEALITYKEFLEKYPEHFLAPEIHFSIAKIHETQKNMQEAKTTYEKIVILYPDTEWASMAQGKISSP